MMSYVADEKIVVGKELYVNGFVKDITLTLPATGGDPIFDKPKTLPEHCEGQTINLTEFARNLQPAFVELIATADGSDLATTQTLANALKAKLNELLAALNDVKLTEVTEESLHHM